MPGLGTIAIGAGIILALIVLGGIVIRWAHGNPLRRDGLGGD